MEAIEDGSSYHQEAKGLNTTRRTLSRIHQDDERCTWYLDATADDERVEEALQEIPE